MCMAPPVWRIVVAFLSLTEVWRRTWWGWGCRASGVDVLSSWRYSSRGIGERDICAPSSSFENGYKCSFRKVLCKTRHVRRTDHHPPLHAFVTLCLSIARGKPIRKIVFALSSVPGEAFSVAKRLRYDTQTLDIFFVSQ